MIRLSNVEKKLPSDIYVTDSITLEGARFIPVNFGGRLVNELGKELLKAAANGDANEIHRLLSEGAPFTADWLGTSPLHLAAQGNHLEVCEILLRTGISTNARTKVDRTPLHMAACEGHLDIVELLLAEEAEIDSTDLLGMTPLHWATQNGHAEIVRALLKFGAHKQLQNKFGLKPVDIAHQINRLDIVEILEEEQHEDPSIATENLTIEMAAEDENQSAQVRVYQHVNEELDAAGEQPQQLEGDVQQTEPNIKEETQTDVCLSDPMKILQEHGITMLPNDDDNNILSTVMESGHSVVLTDVGKQVLNSVKASEEVSDNITRELGKKNYISVSAEEFLALAASMNKNQTQIVRHVNYKWPSKTFKRIVMKKNKLQPISPTPNILKQKSSMQTSPSATESVVNVVPPINEEDVASIVRQLEDAKRTIEEYKQKLIQKEAEAERYKQQLNMFMGFS